MNLNYIILATLRIQIILSHVLSAQLKFKSNLPVREGDPLCREMQKASSIYR